MPRSRRTETLTARRRRAARIWKALGTLVPDAGMILRYGNEWELLVAVILSAQCTDKKVNEVTAKLFRKYRTFADYLKARPKIFEQDVRPTGFYRAKTKNILAAARAVKERFGGKLPHTIEEMITIPGVGRKTANVVLGNAFGVVEGIAVDTHVRRIARSLNLTKENDPEKIEQDLMKLFPKKDWFRLTYRFIEYGRQFCPARSHDHAHCPLTRYSS